MVDCLSVNEIGSGVLRPDTIPAYLRCSFSLVISFLETSRREKHFFSLSTNPLQIRTDTEFEGVDILIINQEDIGQKTIRCFEILIFN